MKFEQFFTFYMKLKPAERIVAHRLPEHVFSKSVREVRDIIRKKLYGTPVLRKSVIGRKYHASTARKYLKSIRRKSSSTSRSPVRPPAPPPANIGNMFSRMKM
jgi:hypothetical protein